MVSRVTLPILIFKGTHFHQIGENWSISECVSGEVIGLVTLPGTRNERQEIFQRPLLSQERDATESTNLNIDSYVRDFKREHKGTTAVRRNTAARVFYLSRSTKGLHAASDC